MTTNDPDQLRRQIEYTQRNLSTDVDLLAEKVTPGKVVNRRVNRVRRSVTSLRDKVMGSASDGASTASARVQDTASSVGQGASSMASSVADGASSVASSTAQAVSETPQAIRRGTEGNPLAAGLIAFGAGWLLSSLVPASKPEQQLAGQATDWVREHGQPVAQEVAQQVQENLREPAQQAVENVKSTASDAAGTVTEEAKSATSDVTGRAQEAKTTVKDA